MCALRTLRVVLVIRGLAWLLEGALAGVVGLMRWVRNRRAERLLDREARKVQVGQSVRTGVYAPRPEREGRSSRLDSKTADDALNPAQRSRRGRST